MPFMTFSKELLPAPFGPISAQISLFRTSKVTPERAVTPLNAREMFLVSRSTTLLAMPFGDEDAMKVPEAVEEGGRMTSVTFTVWKLDQVCRSATPITARRRSSLACVPEWSGPPIFADSPSPLGHSWLGASFSNEQWNHATTNKDTVVRPQQPEHGKDPPGTILREETQRLMG